MIGSVMMLCWKLVQKSVKRAEDCRLTLVSASIYSCIAPQQQRSDASDVGMALTELYVGT
jgi:predicted exporter